MLHQYTTCKPTLETQMRNRPWSDTHRHMGASLGSRWTGTNGMIMERKWAWQSHESLKYWESDPKRCTLTWNGLGFPESQCRRGGVCAHGWPGGPDTNPRDREGGQVDKYADGVVGLHPTAQGLCSWNRSGSHAE